MQENFGHSSLGFVLYHPVASLIEKPASNGTRKGHDDVLRLVEQQ